MTFISNFPPVTESDIKSKPYIIVSAKGIANSLSDIPNDGADFGPDTTLNATDPSQTGAPYTQTYGMQEAINYLASIGGGAIISSGTFNLSTTIAINSSKLNFNFVWEHYGIISGSASPLIQLGDGNNQIKSIRIYISSIQVNNGNIGIRAMYWVQSTLIVGSIVGSGSGTGIEFNSAGISNLAACDNNIFFNVMGGLQYCIHFVGSTTAQQFAEGNRFYGGSIFGNGVTVSPSYGLLIDSNTDAIWGTFIGTIDMSVAPSPNYDFFDNVGKWNVITQYIRGGSSQFITPTNLTANIPNYLSVSTPSVPASGTSNTVENTYPYPVAVYINGSVTGVYITPYGGSQTQIYGSVSNVLVTLSEGDSIALEYTTAPTWVWQRLK